MEPLNPRERVLIALLALCIIVVCQQVNSVEPLKQAAKQCQTNLDVQTRRADSLQVEMFPMQVELGRFETAFAIFARRHPVYADIYANIISDETE